MSAGHTEAEALEKGTMAVLQDLAWELEASTKRLTALSTALVSEGMTVTADLIGSWAASQAAVLAELTLRTRG